MPGVLAHREKAAHVFCRIGRPGSPQRIYLITGMTRQTVSGVRLNDDADAPQGRVGEFGRPTFAGQQKLLNKGLQHAHSAILPDMY